MAPPSRRPLHLARWVGLTRIVFIGYWVMLFTATHIPNPGSLPPLPGADKTVHVTAYMLLAMLWLLHVSLQAAPSWITYGRIFLVLTAYGLVDELLQVPIPGRSGDVRDWAADMLGAALGLVVFAIGSWVQRRLVHRK